MVVHDLNVVGIPVAPNKADTPLIVDPNAVLSLSVSVERFQPIARRRCQVPQISGNIQLAQLPLSYPLESLKPFYMLPGMKPFRLPRPERLDHQLIL